MGATNVGTTIKATSKAAFQKKFKKYQEEMRDYYGHQEGYCGTLNSCHIVGYKNLELKGNTEKRVNDAMEWIWDHTNKREAMVVQVRANLWVVAGWAAE